MNKIKAIHLLMLLLIISLLLISCSKNVSNVKSENIRSSTNAYDEQLFNIINFNGTMSEYDKAYHSYYVKKIDDEYGVYRVFYKVNNCLAVVYFDADGNKLFGDKYNANTLKADFSNIEKGQNIDRVLQIDPNGEYKFLYTGRNDSPKISHHYTKDGYFITIQYNEEFNILSIQEELI